MGNSESVVPGSDRPGPLIEEAKRNIAMGFHEAACVKYKRAYELLKEAGSTAAAARALRSAAETGLLMAAPDYELAAKAFEEVGRLNIEHVVTGRNASAAFANVVFCLLASGRGTTAREKYEEFKKVHSSFDTDIDGLAANAIIEAYASGNRNQTRDRVEGFKDVVVVATWRETLLDKVIERL